MKKGNNNVRWRVIVILFTIHFSLFTTQAQGLTDMSRSTEAKMMNTPLGAVKWTGGFWGDRFGVLSETTIWDMWETWRAHTAATASGISRWLQERYKASTTVLPSTTATCINGSKPVRRSMP